MFTGHLLLRVSQMSASLCLCPFHLLSLIPLAVRKLLVLPRLRLLLLICCCKLLVLLGSDRLRDIPAGAAHGERSQDHHQPARGIAPAHPGIRCHANSGGACCVGAGHATAQNRPRHGEGPRGEGPVGYTEGRRWSRTTDRFCVYTFAGGKKGTSTRGEGCCSVLIREVLIAHSALVEV